MSLSKWKKEQKEKRFKKQKSVIFLFLIFFLVLLILASVFRFYSGLKTSKIRNLSRVNLLVNSNTIYIVSVVGNSEILYVKLPAEEKIRLTRGFGDYPIKAIYKLGELEKKGSQLLGESIQEYFAVPINGVISFEGLPDCDFDIQNKSFLEKILVNAFLKKNKTDVSNLDLFFLWLRVKKIPALEQKYLEVSEIEQKKLDLILEKRFQDKIIVEENKALAIFNATDFQGLGAQAARIIGNTGGRIVNIGNAEERKITLIKFSKKDANSYTVAFLEQIFPGDSQEGEVDEGRANIGIYLGKDYWKKLNEKW